MRPTQFGPPAGSNPADGAIPPYGYPSQGYAAGQPYPQPCAQVHAPPPPAPAARPPMVSIISPDDAKKLRTMQVANFAATTVQLCCSITIILLVRYALGGYLRSPACLAATSDYPFTCEYAYALAAVSIVFGFCLSLMQCLTMDCCGAGRAIEALFDMAAFFWWLAGGITLTIRATEANDAGVEQAAARNAVVALCWVSCALFLVLMCTNMISMKRLGKAYKAAVQQMQQHHTAAPAGAYYGTSPYNPQSAYPPATQVYSPHQQLQGAAPPACPAGQAQPTKMAQPPAGYTSLTSTPPADDTLPVPLQAGAAHPPAQAAAATVADAV